MRRMKSVFLMACLMIVGSSFVLSSAWAVDDSVFGTHWVKFQPTTAEGVLTGCSLNYLAVQADWAYKKGAPVMVNGGIWLSSTAQSIGILLKVGVKDMNAPAKASFERPHFAYLKGLEKNTAQSPVSMSDGDNGYKIFVYNVTDPAVQSVFFDLIGGQKVEVVFNRQKGGMDVNVPLDLSVVSSQYLPNDYVKREISDSVITGFSGCAANLIADFKKKLKK